MSKKAKPGGRIQISGKPYTVLEGPSRRGDHYRVMVRSEADQGGYWALSEGWRCGCGPWKIDGPVVEEAH